MKPEYLIIAMIISLLPVSIFNSYFNRDVTFQSSSIACNIQGSTVNLEVEEVSENTIMLFRRSEDINRCGFVASKSVVEDWVGHKLCFVNKVRTLKITKVGE